MDHIINVVKTSCDTFTVENLLVGDAYIGVHKFSNGGFGLIQIFGENVAGGVVNTFTLSDGIYRIAVDDELDYVIVVLDCTVRTCRNKYFNDILYCNTETNCDCPCETKDVYDFNSFMTAFNLYLMFEENLTYTTGYTYLNTLSGPDYLTNIDTNLLDSVEVDYLLTQMNDYCDTCDKPCKTC